MTRPQDRQLEVVYWASVGKDDKSIAEILGIAYSTIRFHWNKALEVTGAENRGHLIGMALRNKWIPAVTAALTISAMFLIGRAETSIMAPQETHKVGRVCTINLPDRITYCLDDPLGLVRDQSRICKGEVSGERLQ